MMPPRMKEAAELGVRENIEDGARSGDEATGNNCLSVAGKEPSRYSEREMFICFLRILRGRSTQVALCRFQNVHDDSAHAINVQILEMGHSDMM
mmetsp:Transcript_34576/g.55639  ORF Transcript_34576/g.55639 Transcript_34576/m.55639 type:complete len:94 (-) Transcript_34576:9-290(-)